MKKILFTFLSATVLLFTSCLETVQEITIKEDGSGTVSSTSDMGALLGMAKQMGGGAEMEKMGGQKMDTTIAMANMIDSIENISATEKGLMKDGSMSLKMNLAEEQFSTKISFPFSKYEDIVELNKLTNKVIGSAMKDQMAKAPMGEMQGMGDMPDPSSFDDYFDMKFTNDKIERTINKEKYAKVDGDEYLQGIKQASAMGIPVTSTLIINLPRPAEKVEGKNATLSEDKMKLTVKVDIDDFFDHPEKMEFKVKF
ncbi:MAG TPA: hypothetical protein PLX17_09775 [Chitinophagaceae bacterium]|nr:hypothetical protein [Chitinophagaceae bacterium]MBP7313697.1 hypothetical protein [Chitinophagaceae bacterium]HQV55793.1 hypothetical protein [Chitinophagaceae bacterium]HQX96605.1 hypothetical protein [Chitinophagaceae bacterium]HQZ50666.1 hypothetical protein [Chitinophagaceae bacterium]